MKAIYANKIVFTAIIVFVFCFLPLTTAFAVINPQPQVQTNSATNIQYSSAALNGSLAGVGAASYANVWFQWGTDTSYGNETTHQSLSYPGVFSHTIYNLAPNTTFHFRAAAENIYGVVYGYDMVFSTGQTGGQQVVANAGPDLYVNLGQLATLQGSGYDKNGNPVNYHWSCVGGTLSNQNIAQPTYTPPYVQGQGTYTCTLAVSNNYGASNSDSATIYVNYAGAASLSVSKKVINLTSGNLNWQTSVSAKPYDVLSFAITLQASGQDIHNIYVRDILPANLIYKDNLTVNANINYSGNPASGINIGTIPAGGVAVIAYQAQIAPAANFPFGTTILNNSATITSTEVSSQTASAQVLVINSLVQGATNIPTGVANNFFFDSFFLPIFLIILGLWLYLSGNIYRFADWLKSRNK